MYIERDDAFFLAQRPRLFGIAYHMLGSEAEADDVLQDAWVRWHQIDADGIDNATAYLTRIVTNLSIDALRRVKSIREDYPGPWLPQPIVEEIETDASDGESFFTSSSDTYFSINGITSNGPWIIFWCPQRIAISPITVS